MLIAQSQCLPPSHYWPKNASNGWTNDGKILKKTIGPSDLAKRFKNSPADRSRQANIGREWLGAFR